MSKWPRWFCCGGNSADAVEPQPQRSYRERARQNMPRESHESQLRQAANEQWRGIGIDPETGNYRYDVTTIVNRRLVDTRRDCFNHYGNGIVRNPGRPSGEDSSSVKTRDPEPPQGSRGPS